MHVTMQLSKLTFNMSSRHISFACICVFLGMKKQGCVQFVNYGKNLIQTSLSNRNLVPEASDTN